MMRIPHVKLAPTKEAIEKWRHGDFQNRGVDIRTRSGSWRCINGNALSTDNVPIGYWTIRAEGSSNEGKETWIAFDKIAEARGWQLRAR